MYGITCRAWHHDASNSSDGPPVLLGIEDDPGVNMNESKESIQSLDFHFRIVVKKSEIRFWSKNLEWVFPKKHII